MKAIKSLYQFTLFRKMLCLVVSLAIFLPNSYSLASNLRKIRVIEQGKTAEEIARLKAVAKKLADSYIKGLAPALGNVRYAGMYLDRMPEDLPEFHMRAEDVLVALEGVCAGLHPDFTEETEAFGVEPFRDLFEIEKLLPELRQELEKFKSEPSSADTKLIEFLSSNILLHGALYSAHMQYVVSEIRGLPGCENYMVVATRPHVYGEESRRPFDGGFPFEHFEETCRPIEESLTRARQALAEHRQQKVEAAAAGDAPSKQPSPRCS